MAIKIVAEIGINHNGNMETCKELIDVAASAGADAVKFQNETLILFTPKHFSMNLVKVHGETRKETKRTGWSLVFLGIKK